MSFCSLASEFLPPRWKRSCCSLLACPEQGVLCSQLAWLSPWQNDVGIQFPLVFTHFSPRLLKSRPPSCPWQGPAAHYVFAVWDWLCCREFLLLNAWYPGDIITWLETQRQFKSTTHLFYTGNTQFSRCHGKPGKKSRERCSGEGTVPHWGGRKQV